jgi:diaminopimelate decarboxylase
MDALWPKDHEINTSEAEVLSRCQIPFHTKIVSADEAKQAIESVGNKIKVNTSDRIARLRAAVESALKSERRDQVRHLARTPTL